MDTVCPGTYYADSTRDAPHPTKTVLVINYYNYLLQLFTLSILCLWWRPPRRNTICLCSSVCWWMMAQEKSRLHLNTLLECIQSFSRAASSMQFLINGALVLQHKSPLNDAGDTQRKVFSAGQHQWRGEQTVLHYTSGVSGNPIQVRLLLLCWIPTESTNKRRRRRRHCRPRFSSGYAAEQERTTTWHTRQNIVQSKQIFGKSQFNPRVLSSYFLVSGYATLPAA